MNVVFMIDDIQLLMCDVTLIKFQVMHMKVGHVQRFSSNDHKSLAKFTQNEQKSTSNTVTPYSENRQR